MLFTIFNDAVLRSFDPKEFQYNTDEEEYSELARLVEEAKQQGYSL